MNSHTNRIPVPLIDRVLAAWREANPQGLIGRLVELHQRDPERARWLAYYIEQYHADQSEGNWPYQWPYQGLMVDVARWPQIEESPCQICGGRGMLDDIVCWRCHA